MSRHFYDLVNLNLLDRNLESKNHRRCYPSSVVKRIRVKIVDLLPKLYAVREEGNISELGVSYSTTLSRVLLLRIIYVYV